MKIQFLFLWSSILLSFTYVSFYVIYILFYHLIYNILFYYLNASSKKDKEETSLNNFYFESLFYARYDFLEENVRFISIKAAPRGNKRRR